jgi:transposase
VNLEGQVARVTKPKGLDHRVGRRQHPVRDSAVRNGGGERGISDQVTIRSPWRIAIVKRSDTAKGFVLQAKRRIVERTLAWISRNRRLARDFENLARTARALIYLAMIKLMLRRLARS